MSSDPSADSSSGIGSEQELRNHPIHISQPLAAFGDRSQERRGDGFDDMRMIRLGMLANDLGIDRRMHHTRSQLIKAVKEGLASTSAQVTIYLSDETSHANVQSAVEDLLERADLLIQVREDPVIGSWFRQIWVALDQSLNSKAVREGALTAAHVADTRLILAQDATITATLLQNLGPVLASLDSTKDAVLRIGALLIVKVDWTVNVFQLTAAQQARLDHQPQLTTSPQEIIKALGPLEPARTPAPERAGER
ncbi:hypothetical protein ACWC4C_44955 [Streptomyces olivaceoviridis]